MSDTKPNECESCKKVLPLLQSLVEAVCVNMSSNSFTKRDIYEKLYELEVHFDSIPETVKEVQNGDCVIAQLDESLKSLAENILRELLAQQSKHDYSDYAEAFRRDCISIISRRFRCYVDAMSMGIDRRQDKNECEGCIYDGEICVTWNQGLCHEQNYYELPEPVEEERTCGTCGNLGMYTGVCENCDDTNSRWKPRTERKEL